MTQKYSDDVQSILNVWLEGILKLAEKGRVSSQLVENIKKLIEDGNVEDAKKIRFAIENGVKNVGAN